MGHCMGASILHGSEGTGVLMAGRLTAPASAGTAQLAQANARLHRRGLQCPDGTANEQPAGPKPG